MTDTPRDDLRALAEAWWSGRHSHNELPQSKATGPKLQALCNRAIRALAAAQETPQETVQGNVPDNEEGTPAAKVPHEPSPVVSLFNVGTFQLHSGEYSDWKVDCDVLKDRDWFALAFIVAKRVGPFSAVEGVARGGLKLAMALRGLGLCATDGPLLIVDDVLTTGASIEAQRAGRDAIGAVVFARGACPSWVTPLFVTQDTPQEAQRLKRVLRDIAQEAHLLSVRAANGAVSPDDLKAMLVQETPQEPAWANTPAPGTCNRGHDERQPRCPACHDMRYVAWVAKTQAQETPAARPAGNRTCLRDVGCWYCRVAPSGDCGAHDPAGVQTLAARPAEDERTLALSTIKRCAQYVRDFPEPWSLLELPFKRCADLMEAQLTRPSCLRQQSTPTPLATEETDERD